MHDEPVQWHGSLKLGKGFCQKKHQALNLTKFIMQIDVFIILFFFYIQVILPIGSAIKIN